MQEASSGSVSPRSTTDTILTSLDLPPLSQVALSCNCSTPKQLDRWLDSLELQPQIPEEQPRLAAALRSLLGDICQWQAPARSRLALLEMAREETLSCVDHMALHYTVLARAQTAELRRSVLTAVILLQHLARAYASVAAQLAGARSRFSLLGRGREALALARASDGYRRIILASSLFYLAAPRGCWRYLQALLRLAQLRKLATRQVRDPLSGERESAESIYLHSALFSSANPLQLGTDQMYRLWEEAQRWGRSARIVGDYTERDAALLASLSLDQPPIPAARLANCKVDLRHFSTPRGWKIDLGEPLANIDRRLGNAADPLLQKTRAIWAGGMQRSRRRAPAMQDCQIALGLSAICYQLAAAGNGDIDLGASFYSEVEARQRHLALEVSSVDFGSGRTLNDYEVALPYAPRLRRDSDRRERQIQQRYLPLPAQLMNISDLGAGLKLSLDIAGKARTGELIGIARRDGWKAAVVRWQYALPDHCRVGVEILRGDVSPIQARRYFADGRLSDPIAALLLQSDTGTGLILPVPLFKCRDSVEILADGQSRSVTLQRQSLTAGNFACFEFF